MLDDSVVSTQVESVSRGAADGEQGRGKRPPWFVAARARAMELAEAQVDDVDIERTLRHEYQPNYAGRPTPSKQDLARRAERVAKLMGQWTEHLADARASGRAKLQVRLVALAHRDGPGTVQAATFLTREHASLASLDRDVAREMKRLRAMSPSELSTEMDQLAATFEPS